MIEIAFTMSCGGCRRRFKPSPVVVYNRLLARHLVHERKAAAAEGWQRLRPQLYADFEDFCPQCAERILDPHPIGNRPEAR